MNSGDHNIDKLFKDAFDDQEHEFNAAYWQEAHQMLNAGKATPIFTTTYVIIGALSIVLSSILLFSDSTPNEFITANPMTHISPERLGETKITPHINPTTSQHHNTISVIDHKSKLENGKTSNIENLTDENLVSTQKQGVIIDINAKKEKISELKGSSKKAIKPIVKSIPVSHLPNDKMTSATVKSQTNLISKTQTTLPIRIVESKNIELKNKQNTSVYTRKSTDTKTPIISSSVISSSEVFVGSLTPKDLVWEQSQLDLLNINELERKELKPIHQPLTLRVSIGNLWSESLNTSTSNVQTYAQNKNIEISAEYLFKANWGIQLGLSYNSIQEDQAHRGLGLIDNSYWNDIDQSYWDFQQKQVTVQDSTWWLGGWWHYAPYQDSVIDSTYISKYNRVHVTKYDTTNQDFKSKQKIKLIEIPILLTYNFNKERWNFQIASGMSFGFYSNSNGQIIRPGDPVRLESSSKSLFNAIQYNYLLQTELGYSLTDHWQINARPQLKMNLNSIYNNSSGFQHRYLFYGVNVGLAYRF